MKTFFGYMSGFGVFVAIAVLGYACDKFYDKITECEELLKEIRDLLDHRLSG
jgi:hypothetical protein